MPDFLPVPAAPLAESAERLGHYAWVEARLFEILGGWVPEVPELDAKLLLGSQSHHHAWHAELWVRRLPVLAGIDHDDLTVAANDELTAFMHELAEPVTSVEKLAGVYRVMLPHLVATYGAHLERTSMVTDAPTVRALNLVLADETEDWRQGELVVQSLLQTPESVNRAAAHHRRLEGLLTVAGGITGPAAD